MPITEGVPLLKNHKRGSPPPNWLSPVLGDALACYHPAVAEKLELRKDFLGFKHDIEYYPFSVFFNLY